MIKPLLKNPSREDRVKTEILVSSKELLTKYGYGKTTIEDIARNMGKAKSTIYYYFSGKEDIFSAVIYKDLNDLFSALEHAVQDKQNVSEKLRGYVDTFFDFLTTEMLLFNIVLGDTVDDIIRKTILPEVKNSLDLRQIDFVQSIFESGLKNNDQKGESDLSPRTLAYIFVKIMQSMSVDLHLNRNNKDELKNIAYEFIILAEKNYYKN